MKVNRSLTYAYRIADIIQRSGDTATRHVPGQDIEKEHMKSRNRQLRDLESENRQLRQLYEDSYWTLHLVMEAHRRVMDANFGRDNDFGCSRGVEIDDSLTRNFRISAARMVKKINDFLEHQRKVHDDIQKRVEELKVENDLLRRILTIESGVSFQTIVDRLKSSSPIIFPLSAQHNYESSELREHSD
ncbi:hypothetical protein DICVIV_09451 [Dictyocaulus viviparus]|uniref:Uncharacterized protein n=1 Tax=Dictyocaulus viviparus TaxID=29172 RepID=A0A0D8XIR5_DICVI|nr:hypothetical protein DICVIV_09451 [Dictyocaulus viviparus]